MRKLSYLNFLRSVSDIGPKLLYHSENYTSSQSALVLKPYYAVIMNLRGSPSENLLLCALPLKLTNQKPE